MGSSFSTLLVPVILLALKYILLSVSVRVKVVHMKSDWIHTQTHIHTLSHTHVHMHKHTNICIHNHSFVRMLKVPAAVVESFYTNLICR